MMPSSQLTLFNTPLLTALLRQLARGILRLRGWTCHGGLPGETQRCVMIAAPHTSNWDLPYTLMIALVLRIPIRWMGKASLFRFPFGSLMRWLGGMAVDRSRANDLVAASVASFASATDLVLIVPPEGTRSGVTRWKTGFYWIAHGAQVPIALGYLDFARKQGGIASMFQTSGDIERDMAEIRAFYATIKGCREQNYVA